MYGEARRERKREKYFLFPTQEMGAKTHILISKNFKKKFVLVYDSYTGDFIMMISHMFYTPIWLISSIVLPPTPSPFL
jgi:hypothetical protein